MLAVAEIGYILTDVSLRSTRQSTWWKVQWLLPVLTYGTYVLCASTFSQRTEAANYGLGHHSSKDFFLQVAEEGHAWPIRPSRPTRFRRDGPAREVDPSMAAGSLGCQELVQSEPSRNWKATRQVRQVAGTCCALAVLYVLFDCMGRLSCVAGASPDMMGFIARA
ncbi:unnamed protein product [Symbiodinium necroappetens]|uniref:Uncharacterized protein n=1 Tax=Symbiodinium necroappetens TaxID=1628268 RepID=A0A813C941_9DINO|nr:unnamed protein product [Symbiodinium necroappetens]